MKKSLLLLWCFLTILSVRAADQKLAPLPVAVSNNAVAVTHEGRESKIFSFMGMGAKKTWNDIGNQSFEMDMSTGKWTELRPVPGVVGRVAASAAALQDEVFVFGGYVVDSTGAENTLPDVNVLEPTQNRWYRAQDIPVPVDDAVLGVFRNRYVYLIGGWSRTDAVRDVQIYDTEKDRWLKGTPLPGTPVFGHAGGISGETIVYVDGANKNPNGASPKYIASSECWAGKIDKKDITKIEWSKLPPHPGNARYRIAAGGSDKQGRVYFSGGTDNPYDYNGVGYNGQPSEPSPVTFAYNVHGGKWETMNENTPDPVMDARGLLVTSHGLVTVGGMSKGQQVTANVRVVKASRAK